MSSKIRDTFTGLFILSETPEERAQLSDAPQAAANAMMSALTETTDRHLAQIQPYNVEESLIKHHVMLESAAGLSVGTDSTHQPNSNARHASGGFMKRSRVTATCTKREGSFSLQI